LSDFRVTLDHAPYMELLDFIHAGGLHGFMISFSDAFSDCACLMTGMT
jgi:hypothetical protein